MQQQDNAQGNIKETPDQSMHAQAHAIPYLKENEDRELGRRWQEEGDIEARNKLVESHMRLAISYVRKKYGQAISKDDAYQQSYIGLVEAANRYDPANNDNKFSTYAQFWLRASVGEYLYVNKGAVKLPSTGESKAVYFNLYKALYKVQQELQLFDINSFDEAAWQRLTDEINDSERKLKVSKDVVKTVAIRLENGDSSLNKVMSADDEGLSFLDALEDNSDQAADLVEQQSEEDWRRAMLVDAFAGLKPREQETVLRRRVSEEGATLEVLSEEFGVSRERVRQIEEKALEKIRQHFFAATATKFGSNSPEALQLRSAIENKLKFKI